MRSPFQLLLDLFDEPPTPRPAVVPPPAAAPPAPKPRRPGPPADPVVLAPPVAPPVYRNPEANREVLLGDVRVAYELRRAKRKTIGFLIGAQGLVVSAPRWVSLAEIDKQLQAKSAWIVQKLAQGQERHQQLEAARIQWRDGASFPYLGETVIVVLDPRQAALEGGAVLNTAAEALPGVPRLVLHLGLAQDAPPAKIRDAVQAWLLRQAKRLFTERLQHFAPRLGVQWRKLTLSNADTLWGTAKADGSIRLNWRLIHFKLSVIDYVVAHELSHLRVMDHSPRFWATVQTVVPDYKALRAQLKSQAVPRWH